MPASVCPQAEQAGQEVEVASASRVRPQVAAFVTGGGQVSGLIRERDWFGHPLGAPEAWPPPLRATLNLVLSAPDVMFLAWGAGLHLFFNDPALRLLGARAAAALGAPLAEVWGDAFAAARPLIDDALAGHARRAADVTHKLDTGAPTWWTYAYSRVPDEHGAAAGLLIVATETTKAVVAAAEVEACLTQQDVLLQMDQALRETSDPAGMLDLVTQRLGRHLLVDQVCFAEADPGLQFVTVEHEYSTGTVPSALGVRRIEEFGADTAHAAGHARMSALATVPVVRGGRLKAILSLRCREPRAWREQDLVLARWAAERAWAAVVRARGAAALIASETTFRTLAEAMPTHVWTSTPDGWLTWFNDRFHRYTGARPSELEIKRWTSYVHEDDVAGAAEKWQRARTANSEFETEWRLRQSDGEHRWHLTRAKPILGQHAEILSWIGTNTDIEDQKRTTVELAEINQRLEQEVASQIAARDQMWRNSRDLLVIVDADGIFHSVSPSVETILGWTPGEMIGRSVFEFVLPDDERQTVEGFELLKRGVPRVAENRYRHKTDGFRWLSWLSNPAGRFIYATGRHITAEKEAADKLSATQEALRQSQKMEAIGQLTGGVAHDFNNLLTPILGSIDFARRELGDDPRTAKIMSAGAQAADRARTLVGRLLAFSRRQTLDPKPVDLARLLLDMADLIRRSIGPDIQVRFELPDALPPVYVDANQLEMSILNISLNARDAMESVGSLTFLARAPLSAARQVELLIIDTGAGMDAETAARAIEPFFTTKGVGKGTGLGLSMVHGLMAQLGGSLGIQSAPGCGTTIVLRMPVANASPAPPQTGLSEPALRAVPAEGRKILVVDDEDLVLTVTADMLDEEGYHVTEAGSAEEAIRLLDSGYAPDVLITDQSMPGMKGNQLAKLFTERFGPRPVLIATGYSITRDFGFPTISKPFTAGELARRIRQLQET